MIDIDRGTRVKTGTGQILNTITTALVPTPPAAPPGTNIVSSVYDVGPSGATFTPPVVFSLIYQPTDIPDGFTERDLAMAYYDLPTGQWVVLEDSVVKLEARAVTARVSHFTLYTLITYRRPPVPPQVTPAPSPTPAIKPAKPAPPAQTEPAPSLAPTTPPPPMMQPDLWETMGGVILVLIGLALAGVALIAWWIHQGRESA